MKTRLDRLSVPGELIIRYRKKKKQSTRPSNCDLTTRDFFGLGDVVVRHSDDCDFVPPGRKRQPKCSSPATIFDKVSFPFVDRRGEVQPRSVVMFSIRRSPIGMRATDLAQTRIPKSSFKTLCNGTIRRYSCCIRPYVERVNGVIGSYRISVLSFFDRYLFDD